MKVCVVLPCNIYAAPYYKRYEKMLIDEGVPFDLLIWNRANIDEVSKGTVYEFDLYDQVNTGNISKVFKYKAFANFVKKRLKRVKYDKIIFLSSYAGILVLLSHYLKKEYSNKYWIDIRDFTFENIGIYRRLTGKAIQNAANVSISSPAYKEFLPEYNYVIGHNIDIDNILSSKDSLKIKHGKSNQYRISFIGLIRYFDEQKQFIDYFANDDRFSLQFYGMNSEYLQEYCKSKNIFNVDFHGRFSPEETANFYAKTDIINNVYGNNSIAFTTALSNKLYFSAALRIPILVSKNTYMENITQKYGFGFTIDYSNPNLKENLIEWYEKLEQTNSGLYDDYFALVQEDDKHFINSLKSFIVE